MTMGLIPDTRPLHVRVKALANRFDAMAIGADKQAANLAEVAKNHRRDAETLHAAAAELELTASRRVGREG